MPIPLWLVAAGILWFVTIEALRSFDVKSRRFSILTSRMVLVSLQLVGLFVLTLVMFRYFPSWGSITLFELCLAALAALLLWASRASDEIAPKVTPECVEENDRIREQTIKIINRLLALLHYRAAREQTAGLVQDDSFRQCLHDVSSHHYVYDDYAHDLFCALGIVRNIAGSAAEEKLSVEAVEWPDVPALLTELRARLSEKVPTRDLEQRLNPPQPPPAWRTKMNRMFRKAER